MGWPLSLEFHAKDNNSSVLDVGGEGRRQRKSY